MRSPEDIIAMYWAAVMADGSNETAANARKAVNTILEKTPWLRVRVNDLVPHHPESILPIENCPRCPEGKLHCIGTAKPIPKRTPRGLAMCDTCGYYEGQR